MLFPLIFCLVILAIVIIFAFPRFSPIPYFPSNMKDKELILKGLNISNNQTVIDLGAGDGVVIFEAAYEALKKHTDTRFIALDINPILIGIMWIKWLFHPNRKNIRITWTDMFTVDFCRLLIGGKNARDPNSAQPSESEGSTGGKSIFDRIYQQSYTCYLYVSPWLIEKAVSHVKEQIPHARFVSYFYPIRSLKKKEKKYKGIHDLFVYS